VGGERGPVSWSGMPATDLVIITERERQEPIASFLSQLRRLDYAVHVIPRVAYQFIRRIPTPQVLLVDVASREFQSAGLPSSGQATWEHVPVIILATAEEMPGVRFGPGLHDFVILPANPAEVEARIRFTLWKTQGERAPRDQIQVDSLRMNLSTYEVVVDNRRLDLTYKEFELLKFLATHRRRVYSRSELLEQVWESDYYGGTRTVDVHVRRLRAKLGTKVGGMIKTVRNVGYRFG
jgi:DNA-binding response OmpR family regulator